MMSYEAQRAYQKRLRKVIFYSVDMLPVEVATYLKEIAAHGSVRAIEEALETYRPLVDHLAKDYVDFALQMLIMNPEEQDTHNVLRWSSFLRSYYDDFGIRERINCSPPAHIQGPFLYLLRQNEHEGLRLVQSLTNTAVAVWHQREQDLYYRLRTRTPLPIGIALPSGTHEFWGDGRVYYWYRSSLGGQAMVTSALMALEVWLEEQIAAGGDPTTLFEQVLVGSTCVAVVGCCLSAAYVYPERCLRAALPLVCSPAVWRLDLARAEQDRRPPVYWLPHDYPLIYAARRERDQSPHRAHSLPFLAGHYLFADEPLRISFEQAFGQFSAHLPFLFQEERGDPATVAALKEGTEQIQASVKRTNYRTHQIGDQIEIQFDPPVSLPPPEEAANPASAEQPRWRQAAQWAQQTLREGKQADGMTAVEAITAVRDIQREWGEQEADISEEALSWLAPAIAVAALVTDIQEVQEHGMTARCRESLLEAAQQEPRETVFYTYPANVPDGPSVLAAQGLRTLVVRGIATEEVRAALLHLAALPYERVIGAILGHLDAFLDVDEVLCWTIVSLVLSLRLIPRHLALQAMLTSYNTGERSADLARWEEQLIEVHVAMLNQQNAPDLPHIPIDEETCFLWDQAESSLDSLPLTRLCAHPSAKMQILYLVTDLVAWTITVNTSSPEYAFVQQHEYPPYKWNQFFFAWIVRVISALSQEEAWRAVLTPLLEQWAAAPNLLDNLMYNYLEQCVKTEEPLTTATIALWKSLCMRILESAELARWANASYLESSRREVIRHIVFAWLPRAWPHAALFREILDKWVTVIGHNPDAYPAMLTFLHGPGRLFSPEPALEWISRCVAANSRGQQLWQAHRNAERTAEFLQRAWDAYEEQIRRQPATLKRYTELVDQLVGAGVPLASVLQMKLEL